MSGMYSSGAGLDLEVLVMVINLGVPLKTKIVLIKMRIQLLEQISCTEVVNVGWFIICSSVHDLMRFVCLNQRFVPE